MTTNDALPDGTLQGGSDSRSVQPRRRRRNIPMAVLLTATLVGLAYSPFLTGSPYWITVAAEAAVLAILGIALNITLGRAGFMDLGPTINFGIGGYLFAILWQNGITWWIGIVISVLACFVVGSMLGGLVARATGIYMGIVLLAFAESLSAGADRNILGLTGGENGRLVTGLPRFLNVNVQADTFYLFALGMLVLAMIVVRILDNSMLGWTWAGIKNNRVRVASSGIDVRAQHSVAFAISGAFAGLAGALFVISIQLASPELFAVGFLIQALLIVIIGGPGSYWGVIFGAAFVRFSPAFIDSLERRGYWHALPDWIERLLTSPLLVLGVIYIIVVLYLPGGFASLRFESIRNRLARRPAA